MIILQVLQSTQEYVPIELCKTFRCHTMKQLSPIALNQRQEL